MEYNPRFSSSSSSSFFTQQHPQSSSGSGTTTTSSSGSGSNASTKPRASEFDLLVWYPKYQSCQRYFLEVAQYSYPCQALAAFINIKLPFQRTPAIPSFSSPSSSSSPYRTPPAAGTYATQPPPPPPPPPPPRPSSSSSPPYHGWVSLHPYIRRLVATGFDVAGILHGWFGDEWGAGVGPLHEQERRNYLFAAKSGGWASVKQEYDVVVDEAVPYLMPLSEVGNAEIEGAERLWSRWLAMEDWMLGARAPGREMEGC